MALEFVLWSIVAFLGLSVFSLIVRTSKRASRVIYGACLVVALSLFVVAARALGAAPVDLVLPIGLP